MSVLKVSAIIAIALLATVSVYYTQYRKNEVTETVYLETQEGQEVNALFQSYKQQNGLRFGSSENTKRLEVFADNLKVIKEHNAQNSTYTLGITPLTHLTHEEFVALKLGYHSTAVESDDDEANFADADIDEHQSTNTYGAGLKLDIVDWVAKGAVTHVKNQGSCQCCWAFSTTGALEGLNFVRTGELLSLSEQELVDCNYNYINKGCNGGLMTEAFKYVAEHGIASAESYPFTGVDGICRREKTPRAFRIRGHSCVYADGPRNLEAALHKQPVAVAVQADSQTFQLYRSGVITSAACGTRINHAVLAVGYGIMDGTPYFKIKNSWSRTWGDDGYVYVGRSNGRGACGVNMDPSHPTM